MGGDYIFSVVEELLRQRLLLSPEAEDQEESKTKAEPPNPQAKGKKKCVRSWAWLCMPLIPDL